MKGEQLKLKHISTCKNLVFLTRVYTVTKLLAVLKLT